MKLCVSVRVLSWLMRKRLPRFKRGYRPIWDEATRIEKRREVLAEMSESEREFIRALPSDRSADYRRSAGEQAAIRQEAEFNRLVAEGFGSSDPLRAPLGKGFGPRARSALGGDGMKWLFEDGKGLTIYGNEIRDNGDIGGFHADNGTKTLAELGDFPTVFDSREYRDVMLNPLTGRPL